VLGFFKILFILEREGACEAGGGAEAEKREIISRRLHVECRA